MDQKICALIILHYSAVFFNRYFEKMASFIENKAIVYNFSVEFEGVFFSRAAFYGVKSAVTVDFESKLIERIAKRGGEAKAVLVLLVSYKILEHHLVIPGRRTRVNSPAAPTEMTF